MMGSICGLFSRGWAPSTTYYWPQKGPSFSIKPKVNAGIPPPPKPPKKGVFDQLHSDSSEIIQLRDEGCSFGVYTHSNAVAIRLEWVDWCGLDGKRGS